MAIRQLSVFVENKKGSLHEITDVLSKAGIDLRSMCIADTQNFGIVRIIASDPERAAKILTDDGHAQGIGLGELAARVFTCHHERGFFRHGGTGLAAGVSDGFLRFRPGHF